MAPVIGSWIEACFPEGLPTSKAGIDELIAEAGEATRNDFGVDAANEWAGGYTFPLELLASDVRCLRAAQLDFRSMVERRLKILSKDRLSRDSMATLSPDNPELELMEDLGEGMRVAISEGFVPNGLLLRSYESVSTAVDKLLGAVMEQRLAFILPLQLAQAHIPNLHLCKAHWTTKKGKASTVSAASALHSRARCPYFPQLLQGPRLYPAGGDLLAVYAATGDPVLLSSGESV